MYWMVSMMQFRNLASGLDNLTSGLENLAINGLKACQSIPGEFHFITSLVTMKLQLNSLGVIVHARQSELQ